MPNNISVAITADVADLTAKMAIAKVQVADTSKTLRDLARASGGEMSPALMQAAEAASQASASAARLAREAKTVAPALESTMHGSAGVTRELLVMGRELSRGNFNRMAGSATILAGRLGVLTPSVLMTAGAIGLLAAPMIAFGVASYKGSEELTKLQNALRLTNGYAGVTTSQLQELSRQLAQSTNVSIGTATTTMTKLAASGKFTSEQLLLVGQNATLMGRLTGESADKFIDDFAKMGGDVAKFAVEFNDHYHFLSVAQIDHIRLLEQEGRTAEAQLELQKDLYTYLGQNAPEQLHGLEGAIASVGRAFSSAFDKAMAFSRVVEGIGTTADQIRVIDAQMSRMQNGSSVARFGIDTTGLAALQKQRDALVAQQKKESDAAAAKGKKDQIQQEGIDAQAKLSAAFENSKTSGEKLKKTLADINIELAKAKAANPANSALYEKEAAAARSQAIKSDTPHTPKGPKGPSAVAEWSAEFEAQKVASNEFFKDLTEDELKFWQSKKALTAAGSKDQLEVEAKIYELSKALARQGYQDQIAAYGEKIQADRNNWSKELADLKEKQAYIKATHGEDSAEYRNAAKEIERAQQDHDDKILAQTQRAAKEQTDELKRSLDTEAKARDDNARAAEVRIRSNANGSPFGDIKADQQIAAMQQQLIVQKLADNDTFHAAESARLDAVVAAAKAKYGEDREAYAAEIAAKKAEDQRYADAKRTLDAQMALQQAQTVAQMQSKYESYIGSTVSTTISGLDRMISGQMTLRNFGISVYQSIAREAEQQVAKMATQWVAKHVIMAIASRMPGAAAVAAAPAELATTVATSKAKVLMLAGVAGAGGVASMAAAPFPMDLTAPAFGAQMAATALSMGQFAQGTNFVPNDMVAQIHAGERIIPKADNDTLMELTARGAGRANSGGDHYHTHYSPQINGQMPFADQLDMHESNILSMLQRAARRGVRFA